ncbi:hypothetical protein [Rhodopseudomonas pentothenatexigens]|uniref:hypothetical protein n=1 Tax=Rhodopseudomonas TaxID=1073 RepID=UPI0024C01FC5|nr:MULTISPECIES: hypothetical protein [Rhodopseudomonas]
MPHTGSITVAAAADEPLAVPPQQDEAAVAFESFDPQQPVFLTEASCLACSPSRIASPWRL